MVEIQDAQFLISEAYSVMPIQEGIDFRNTPVRWSVICESVVTNDSMFPKRLCQIFLDEAFEIMKMALMLDNVYLSKLWSDNMFSYIFLSM